MMDGMPPVLREVGRARAQLAIAVVAALAGLAMFTYATPDDRGPAVGGALIVAAAIGILLFSRRGVVCGEEGITLRYTARSRFIPWHAIERFAVDEIRRNDRGPRMPTPIAALRSGEVVVLPGADPNWLPKQRPYRVVGELQARLTATRRA